MTTVRTQAISDLLPPEAIDQIGVLIEQGRCTVTTLKPITNKYKEELLAKGVDADYLAYAIEFAVRQAS